MAKLTEEQETFLISHSIPLSAVFDATGIWSDKAYCKEMMKSLGKWIAFGTRPCNKAGHTLYTRSRHCIQCDTAKIAFMRRNLSDGFVYVAGSLTKEIIKVGQSNNPTHRVKALNDDEMYGGVRDWRLLYYAQVPSSGEVEFKTHRLLDDFAAPITYTYRGRQMDSLETFYCSYERAIQAIEHSSSVIHSSDRIESSEYEFPEITGHNFYRKGNRTSSSRSNPPPSHSNTGTTVEDNQEQDAIISHIPKPHKKAVVPEPKPPLGSKKKGKQKKPNNAPVLSDFDLTDDLVRTYTEYEKSVLCLTTPNSGTRNAILMAPGGAFIVMLILMIIGVLPGDMPIKSAVGIYCVLCVVIFLMARKLPTGRDQEIRALAEEVSISAGIPFSELERRVQNYRNASVTVLRGK